MLHCRRGILTCNRSGFVFLFSLSSFVHSCSTSFGQKYDLFSLLGKQMDIFLGILYTVRKVSTFWPNPILVCVIYIARDEF